MNELCLFLVLGNGVEQYKIKEIENFYVGKKEDILISLKIISDKGLVRQMTFTKSCLDTLPIHIARSFDILGDGWLTGNALVRGEDLNGRVLKPNFIISERTMSECYREVIINNMDVYTLPKEGKCVLIGKYGKILNDEFSLKYCIADLPVLEENYVTLEIDEMFWCEDENHHIVNVRNKNNPDVIESFKLVDSGVVDYGILSQEDIDNLLAIVDDEEEKSEKEFTKHDKGKRNYSLLPPRELGQIVDVLGHGANKYGIDNWKRMNKEEIDRYISALYRHFEAWRAGEKDDPDSGYSHLAHVACNCLFLMWFENEYK